MIRSTYGGNETYFDLNVRALELWKENQERFGKKIFFNTGVLWFCYEEKTPLVDDSLSFALNHKMNYEYLAAQEIEARYPLINTHDLHHAYFDPYGGYLKARESTQHVQEAFLKEGGNYIQSHVRIDKTNRKMEGIFLSNGNQLQADVYLFACGAWLGELFPSVLGNIITCTKQEVYYFGNPPADSLSFESLPVWVDVDGKNYYYGIPGNAYRGFKIGVDERGEAFDPTPSLAGKRQNVLRLTINNNSIIGIIMNLALSQDAS